MMHFNFIRPLLLVLLISFFIPRLSAQEPAEIIPPTDACYECHIDMDLDQDEVNQLFTHYLNDIHFQRGLLCSDCHGGDPEAFDEEDDAMWENDTYLGEISPNGEIAMCGKCHSDPAFMRKYSVSVSTDQESQYWTSKHGQSLKEGNLKVATCTDCHGVHGILAVDNPNSSVYDSNVPKTCSMCHSSESYMKGILETTSQYDDYVKSVHGKALLEREEISAPACNDCHGNHGAAPPEVSSINEICGSCHAQNRDLFQKSHLASVFKKEGLPQCESCHGNHYIVKPSDDFLNWESASGAVCLKCHEDGGKAKLLADQLFHVIDSLKINLDSAKVLIEKAEIKGMEISDLYFELEDAHNALIHSRTSVHSFDSTFVRSTAQPGFVASNNAKIGAKKALEEFEFRRFGLFVASFIITLLVILLYLKVKVFEKMKEKEKKNEKI
jgi:hypothetical protein